jgi:predicted ATPase
LPELPTGTVTFLFTDIEGSTRLLEEHGDNYATLLEQHRRSLREAFGRHCGVEVDTQGDAFFVAFSRASDALAAAEDAQRALDLPVRMGIHTGEPTLMHEGYIGMDVHRAARICAAGHGGQILVSEATQQLLDGASLRDVGEHRLKDLGRPIRLFQLGDEEFPPLLTLNRTNLPAQPSELVGRARELAELLELLGERRLLTLTGPGGSGKTRLSLQVAAEALERFAGGVFFVPLAAVSDPDLVLPTVGQTIGAQEGVAEHVGKRDMLLLLDNLEQVLEAAPALAELLERAPNLRLLVTSRALLRIAGEHEYPVEPLPEGDAVELFRERAAVAEPIEAVAEICRRLDGLPLAVELAAARTRLLSPEQLLERLERALPLLTGGRRDAPERQRTLRATIEWSSQLLDPAAQQLLRRLSVFAGSFTLEAAEEVCEANLETLESLLDHSLVRRWASGRLGMLETIREFAVGQLEASGEDLELRRRHAGVFLECAEEANLSVEGIRTRGERGFAVAIAEQANLRAALGWFLEAGEVERATSLAVALEHFWVTNSPAEGVRWLTQLLERGDGLPEELHVRVVRALAGTTYILGDFEAGTRYIEQALAEYESLGDPFGVAHMTFRLAVEANRHGDPGRARALCEETMAVDPDGFNEAQVLTLLGNLAFEEGQADEAIDLLDRSAAVARQIGFAWWQTNALQTAAEYLLKSGRARDVGERINESLVLARRIGDRQGKIYGLCLLALAKAEEGDAAEAGRLWGVIEEEETRGVVGQWELERDEYQSRLVELGGEAFDKARTSGRGRSIDDVIDAVLAA